MVGQGSEAINFTSRPFTPEGDHGIREVQVAAENYHESNPSMTLEAAIKSSIQYLNSKEAADSIRQNPYWPKWNSPWWHMSLLFEMKRADQIPKHTASRQSAALGPRMVSKISDARWWPKLRRRRVQS